jgi:hypothetical protein
MKHEGACSWNIKIYNMVYRMEITLKYSPFYEIISFRLIEAAGGSVRSN